MKSSEVRDEQSTPALIRSQTAPMKLSKSSSKNSIVYNKYIPVDYQPKQRQLKDSLILGQRLSNQSYITEYPSNRYIEYKKPHRIIQLEIIHLPIIKMDPRNYSKITIESIQLDRLRSSDISCRI